MWKLEHTVVSSMIVSGRWVPSWCGDLSSIRLMQFHPLAIHFKGHQKNPLTRQYLRTVEVLFDTTKYFLLVIMGSRVMKSQLDCLVRVHPVVKFCDLAAVVVNGVSCNARRSRNRIVFFVSRQGKMCIWWDSNPWDLTKIGDFMSFTFDHSATDAILWGKKSKKRKKWLFLAKNSKCVYWSQSLCGIKSNRCSLMRNWIGILSQLLIYKPYRFQDNESGVININIETDGLKNHWMKNKQVYSNQFFQTHSEVGIEQPPKKFSAHIKTPPSILILV